MATIKLHFVAHEKDFTGPRALIVLDGHGVSAAGHHLSSGSCFSIGELEENVMRLKKELDAVLREARKKFRNS